MKILKIFAAVVCSLLMAVLLNNCGSENDPIDWGDYNLLTDKPPRPPLPEYNGKKIPYDEYIKWVYWGEEWFRNETFGNERLWTDIVGFLDGEVDVLSSAGTWKKESVFKLFLESVDELDGKRGNLFSGNGNAYTHDLVITFPKGSKLDGTFNIPEKLHTGLDIEAGAVWPIGVVPKKVKAEEEDLPYLLDPSKYSSGEKGIGSLPGGGKFRVGLACALCHYSLDVDWDGKTDLKSARPGVLTEGTPYRPEHSWAIGNQDISLGWIFALSVNSIAGFENSGVPNKTQPRDAREWAKWVLANYKIDPGKTRREVDRGLIMFPRGFADDTPDGLHNPLQLPSLFTNMNWPFNYDGVMINASDRNNNVWTTGLDLSQLVALCSDRAGKTSKIAFWEEQGLYSVLKAEEYADILVAYSPAVLNDASQRTNIINDILGVSDGLPGLLDNKSLVLIKGVPGAIPKNVLKHPDNEKYDRIREPAEFGADGKLRGAMVGLLGTRVITPPEIVDKYQVNKLAQKYGINTDEFTTESISLMLNWVQPPPNKTELLKNSRTEGLIKKGYEIFKNEGCADCHAGPFTTDNLIYKMKEIKTNEARAKATKLLQTIAPPYNPQTGIAASGGLWGIIENIFSDEKKPGYKTVTLQYLWGSAPYLHDGGVAVAVAPGANVQTDDLNSLLKIPGGKKIYGVAQILLLRESGDNNYLRANAALSLQALLLKDERDLVMSANKQAVYPIPATDEFISISKMQIEGKGHEYWIDDEAGGKKVTALVAFLLSLDDNPGE